MLWGNLGVTDGGHTLSGSYIINYLIKVLIKGISPVENASTLFTIPVRLSHVNNVVCTVMFVLPQERVKP